MNNRRTTLKDIAQRLGVSKTLVSFVVRDLPDGHNNISVRPELRQSIKELAREMNYVAHRSARTLRTGQSRMVGVISASSDHPLYFAIQQKLFNVISEHGYEYILQDVEYMKFTRMENAISMMIDYSVDGIILVGIDKSTYLSDYNQRLQAHGIPVCAVGGTPEVSGPWVVCGDYEAGYNLAKEMIAKGRSKFYAITPTNFFKDSIRPGRIDGIQDACKIYGGVQVLMSRQNRSGTESDIEVGYYTTKEFIDKIDADTLFFSSDFMAFGGLRALQEAGLKCPEDIYVCGFDGIELARFSSPSITTAIQPAEQMALTCADSLFKQIESGVAGEHTQITIPAEISLRESTGD